MAQVFLSYAAEDRARIEPLARAIEAGGLSVWWDRHIGVGSKFDDVIDRELNAASCVVVVWSKHSVGSEWVRNEANEGAERGILVPAQIDAARPPLAFRRTQSAQLLGWPDGSHAETIAELVRGIRDVVGKRTGEPVALVEPERPANRRERIVVAVLPLADRSPERNMAYLCEGLAEDLMNALFSVAGLRVLSTTDTFRFKDSILGSAAIGASLGATVVLEGSVQRADERLAISTRLVEVSSGVTIYSQRFERSNDDVFGLQAEVAQNVLEGLQSKLGLTGNAPHVVESRTRDPEAFELYTALRDPAADVASVVVGTPLILKRVVALECVIALDPTFDRAYVDLVRYYTSYLSVRAEKSMSGGYRRGPMAKAKALLAQLESRDPNNPLIFDIRVHLETDMSALADRCHSMMLRGERLFPYAHPTGLQDVRSGYARALAHSGLPAEAAAYLAQIDRVKEPNRFDDLLHAAGCLVACGEFERAVTMCRRIAATGQDSNVVAPTWEVVARLAMDDLDGAVAVPRDIDEEFYESFTRPLLSAKRDGTPIDDAAPGTVPHFKEIRGYALLAAGDIERGIRHLIQAIEADVLGRHWVGCRIPIFSVLFSEQVKQHPRYQTVLSSVKLDVASREKMRAQAATLTPITGIAVGPLLDL